MACDAAGGVGGVNEGMTAAEYLAKVTALKSNVFITLTPGRYYDPNVVMDLFTRYASVRDGLRSEFPALFGDLPVRQNPKPSATTDFEGRGYLTFDQLFLLHRDLQYCETILTNLPEAAPPSLAITREGVFFAGQYFDALSRITEILARAKSSVVLIDGYIDQSVLKLFGSKPKGVSVRVLTKSVSVYPTASGSSDSLQQATLWTRYSSVYGIS